MRSLLRDARGFTLIEVMVAAMVLVVGTLGVVAMVDTANRQTSKTKGREGATALARQVIEDARAIPFEQLAPNAINADLQSQPGLEAIPGTNSYTVRRRNFTYTITANVCSLDDPRDGIGSHTGGNFCTKGSQWKGCQLLGTVAQAGDYQSILGQLYNSAQTAAQGTNCTSGTATAADLDPEDYKRVDVTVDWDRNTTRQSTLIDNPGSAAGPAVTSLTLNDNGGNTTVTSSSSSLDVLDFAVTTSRTPAAVNWTLDGDNQGQASGAGTSWAFGWNVGPWDNPIVYDGSYIVGARAVNSNGVAGATRTLTITLNRRKPFAPTGLLAGRNNQVVDIEWRPNRERDVVGYRVFRVDAAGPTQVCPAPGASPLVKTSCQDTSPPATSPLQYYVVAVDRDVDGTTLRNGDASTTATVVEGNHPPNPPTNLQASVGSTSTRLIWQAPNPADPDAGDSIRFYRIYRDGKAYTDRYDRTGSGSDLSYTDTSTGGVPHSYWITAVDSQLAESTIVGPVP